MTFGWSGKILRVDLTNKKIKKEQLNKEFAKSFIGGRGFNSKILYDEYDPKISNPFAPENIICISSGLLSGTTVPCSGRTTISIARSPLTNIFSDGNAGGHFGPELSYAGYDVIVLYGKAEKLSYLRIEDDEVEIRNGEHLKNMSVGDTTDTIKKELDDSRAQILAIGPAGENFVALAATFFNLARPVGAGGNGAVFGSKNIKAVAVRGTKGKDVAHPDDFHKLCDDAYHQIISHPVYEGYAAYGTTMLLGIKAKDGGLPVKNFQTTILPNWQELDSQEFIEKYVTKSKACFNCPIHCSHFYKVLEGDYAGTYGEGPEYGATYAVGSNLGNTHLPSVLHMNTLANSLGLDIEGTGNALAVAMHWWQDGIIDKKDTQGLKLEWGNHEAIVELIKKIAYRKGFGEIMANGIIKAAEIIAKKKGLPSEKLKSYVNQVKGMLAPGEDWRYLKGTALSFATSTRGADHLRGMPTIEVFSNWYRSNTPEFIEKDLGIPREVAEDWFNRNLLNRGQYEGKGHLVKFYQDHLTCADALGICKFITSWRFGIGPIRLAKLVSAATGINYSWKDIQRCGERIFTVEYAMQRRFGLNREDDYPPKRFFKEPISDGPQKGRILNLEKYDKMLSEFYELRGYDQEGVPTEQKLIELGMEDVAQDLKTRGIIKSENKKVPSKKVSIGNSKLFHNSSYNNQ